MQDKDFDQFIQRAMENQPEPEYNPADWDKLEDRLHNLHGNQPNAAGKGAAAGSAGKLGFIASAILVTALNVVFFTKPELLKNAIGTASQTTVTSEGAVNNQTAQTSNSTAISATSAHSENNQTTNQALELETGKEAVLQHNNIASVSGSVNSLQMPASGNTDVSGSKQNARTNKNNRNTLVASSNGQSAASWSWSPVAAGRPGTTTSSNLTGGRPAGIIPVEPCNVNLKQEINAVLIGNDTLRGSRIALSTCQNLDARFFIKAADAARLNLTSNIAKVLPGARFVREEGTAFAALQLQPTPEMARQQPYIFNVWVADNNCPNAAPHAYQFALSVTPAFTVAINGNTKLEKGEETILEVKGAPLHATYQWLSGRAILPASENGRLVVTPTKTTTYRLLVNSPAGCTFTDSVKVEVSELRSADGLTETRSVPNIFTPNGDGRNDNFEVHLPAAGPIDLRVFDRWGKQVFAQNNYDNTWNAANLEEGVYYYIITTQADQKSYKGWVEVIR